MKRDQVVVSQATKNPSSFSNIQPLRTTKLQKQRKIINRQGGGEGKTIKTQSVEQINNPLPTQGHHQHEINRFTQIRQPFSRYKELFYGYCFYCSNFGNKAVNCSLRLRHEQLIFPRNKYLPQQRMIQPSNKPSQIANC